MLTHISITGADNNTSIDKLVELSQKYPYAEWGILYFPEKEGAKRNPTKDWRNDFLSSMPKDKTAIHLCGEDVFNEILSDNFDNSELKEELSRFGRIQLNINARKLKNLFTDDQITQIYKKLLACNFRIIAQYNPVSEKAINSFINTNEVNYNYFDILLDSSLGKGVVPENWSVPELFKSGVTLGFAGGLNPENIHDNYLKINKITNSKYWLDLESGARTDNEFDLEKAENILSQFKGSCS
jgi:phosphoribosylanthranilate isomerase